jgi:ribose transport system permease protein
MTMSRAPHPDVTPSADGDQVAAEEHDELQSRHHPGVGPRRAIWWLLQGIDRGGVILVWAITIVIFGILRPDTFLTWGNFQAILGTQAVLLILSLALLLPFAAGEFDLSVAGTLGLGYVLIGYLTSLERWPLFPALVVTIAAAVVVGLINAALVVWLGVSSIIVTLGTGTALFGLGYAVLSQPVTGIAPGFVSALSARLWGLPVPFYVALGITAILWYVFRCTPVGQHTYFVGMSPRIARLSGINVSRIRVGVFVVAAVISALAGLALAGYTGASDPTTANSYLLPVFAAVFLGQTTIEPGRFNPVGTVVSVYFLSTGVTGLQLMGLGNWVGQVFYGLALIAAVAVTRLSGRTVLGGARFL